MSARRPIRADVSVGPPAERADQDAAAGDEGAPPDLFREGLSRWAATVTLVAVREPDTGRVHATTATSFAPVSAEPPRVALALGPGAQVVPFLDEGVAVGVSLLAEDQKRWAAVFADAFAVTAPEWTAVADTPGLPGAVVVLACRVQSLHPADGGATLALCGVDEVHLGDAERPLLYWNRSYTRLSRD